MSGEIVNEVTRDIEVVRKLQEKFGNNATDVLDHIAEVAPSVIEDEDLIPNYCIFATAVGIEVCEKLGIEASPLSVEVGTINELMLQWVEAGGTGPQPEGAWGVGISNEPPEGIKINVPSHGKTGWNGHLVTEVVGWGYLDLNSGPLARPKKGIEVPSGLYRQGVLVEDEWDAFRFDGVGAVVMYRLAKSGSVSESWKTAPDWKRRGEYASRIADNVLSAALR